MSDQPKKPWRITPEMVAKFNIAEEARAHADICEECHAGWLTGDYCATGESLANQFWDKADNKSNRRI